MKIAQTTDYNALAKLNKNVHELHVHLYPNYFMPYSYSDMVEEFKKLVEKEYFIFLILTEDNEDKGFVFYEIVNKPGTPFKKPYKTLYVHQISVEKADQKKGIGDALMNEVTKAAKESKVDCIELDYWVKNENARNFYKKRGFKVEREFVRKNL
ncbi:GNAT family N-acetyltransferase [Virgibacillus sp. C22-A2]|uniref:GNAT family N-acetyltransferase n=1 Tax=Virgibacillus tibetensis TaxID=3042313 RepID=A0ABU6KJY9_9BACI|nr:GNAT family N-acetyltransferase [Virgibacillus sp. C22-A2]